MYTVLGVVLNSQPNSTSGIVVYFFTVYFCFGKCRPVSDDVYIRVAGSLMEGANTGTRLSRAYTIDCTYL